MPWNITWDAFATPNITGFYDAFAYYNTVTGDGFGLGLMVGLYAILLLIFSRWGMKTSFSSASFIMFALSGIMRATGLVGDMVVTFFLLMTGVGLLVIMWNR